MLAGKEEPAQKESIFSRKLKSDTGKVSKKKKGEKSPAQKRIQEAQRVAAVQAYRDMKARKQTQS
jgi:hypothetical protein